MSTPAPGGSGRSTLRTAGVALVGLALVLTVIGVLTGGSGTTSAASPPSSSSPVRTSATTTTATPTTTATATPTTTTTPAPTPAPTTPAPPSTDTATTAPDPRSSVDVVVLNNSTIGGLAARAAAEVRGRGWTVVEVGNFAGQIPTTTAYYRPGTPEEAAARSLAADVGARVEPRYDGLPPTAAGVVLVVTSDFSG